MMQLDRSRIESALSAKGFAREDTHHRYFYHEHQGKRTGIHTYTSHGSGYKTYPDPLLRSMRQQLRLDTVAQLADLVNCPMSQDAYNEHLKGKGLLPIPQPSPGAVARADPGHKDRKRRRRR
jgi:hypothetical protein